MTLENVIGRCKHHDIDAVLLVLFLDTLCAFLFASKYDRLNNFSTSDREMNVNISN